jgi:quercetin dioxygenase-like cupin family protein
MTDSTSYFVPADENAEGGDPGTWVDLQNFPSAFPMLPGLMFRPVASGNIMINLVTFEPDVFAPLHSHPEEQVSYVVEGELEFVVSGETRIVGPGMAVFIPSNAPHSARTRQGTCTALDIFSPPRQALLDAMASKS